VETGITMFPADMGLTVLNRLSTIIKGNGIKGRNMAKEFNMHKMGLSMLGGLR
jgi:hypothetical protein